jgi:predicted nucleic acid-binding protein
MSLLVVDASVILKCLLAEPGSPRARQLVEGERPPLAPELLLAECANAVWKRVHRGLMAAEGVAPVMADLTSLSATLLPLRELTPDALSIALEYDHPVYDCYYIAAAIQNDATLATADAKLYDLAQRVGLGERAILVR